MTVRIIETDLGTKAQVKRVIEEINEWMEKNFDNLIGEYWRKVCRDAWRLCPIDTGALRASIRVTKETPEQGLFMVVKQPTRIRSEWMITAGGRVINPKTNKPVDYASIVHDGSITRPPTPFLTDALDMNEKLLAETIKKIIDKISEIWSDKGVIPKLK